MGEIADMMLNGIMCAGCGEWLDNDEECGFPLYCASCQPDDAEDHTTFNDHPRPKKKKNKGGEVKRVGATTLSLRLWRRLVNLSHPSGPTHWADHGNAYDVLHRLGLVDKIRVSDADDGFDAAISEAGRAFLEGVDE